MVLHQHARAWYCRRKHWQHQAGSGSEPFPHVKKDRERKDTAVWLQCAPVATMDRGVYTSDDFRDLLAKHGIECSMSGSANCYDNAVVESFFGLLKRERVNRVRYRTREEARADIFEYIEVFYNRKRRHGYLGNVSPADFEKQSAGSFETVH